MAEPKNAMSRRPVDSTENVLFDARVRDLQRTWDEHRLTLQLSQANGFAAKLDLLRTIHGWIAESLVSIERYYGRAANPRLDPMPGPEQAQEGFRVTLFDLYSVRFFLSERRSGSAPTWAVAGEARAVGPRPTLSSVGPTRRHGVWSRERLEQILLSVVSQYERQRTEAGPIAATERRRRTSSLRPMTLEDLEFPPTG